MGKVPKINNIWMRAKRIKNFGDSIDAQKKNLRELKQVYRDQAKVLRQRAEKIRKQRVEITVNMHQSFERTTLTGPQAGKVDKGTLTQTPFSGNVSPSSEGSGLIGCGGQHGEMENRGILVHS